MQATEAAPLVIGGNLRPFGTIPGMAERKPDHRGVTAQRAILAELRRRELAEPPEDAPGVRELARALGQGYTPTRHHVVYLVESELIEVVPGRGRSPGMVTLTKAGRTAADLFTPPCIVV